MCSKERDCIISPADTVFFYKKRAAVARFQINLREWKLDPALPTASVIVAMLWSDGFFIWFAGHVGSSTY